jgi:hypothetical protein
VTLRTKATPTSLVKLTEIQRLKGFDSTTAIQKLKPTTKVTCCYSD